MAFAVCWASVLMAMAGVLVAAIVLPGLWWLPLVVFAGYDAALGVLQALLAGRRSAVDAPGPLPGLDVLVPARDEMALLPATLAAIRGQLAPGDSLLVIADGCRDGTAGWCRAHGIAVLDKPGSGKADSLDQGARLGRAAVVVVVDADTVLAPGALSAVREAFAADPALAIAGGVLEPTVRPGPLAAWLGWHQRAEYLRSFLWRSAWERLGCLLLVSGACCAVRRDRLEQCGGFASTSPTEDYELTHRLCARALEEPRPWRAAVLPGARGTTDAPNRIRALLAQRQRWFAGFLGVQVAYRRMFAMRGGGTVGWLMLPVKTCDTVLPLVGLAGWALLATHLVMGRAPPAWVWTALGGKLAVDLALAAIASGRARIWLGLGAAPGLRRDMVLATAVEPLAYLPLRQLAAALGWISFLRGRIAWSGR